MSVFEASTSFPTVVFTVGLVIALVYWVFVLIGALDIDLFGGDAATGGAKGAVEGLKGIKLDTDTDVDGGGLWAGLGLSKVPITISFSVVCFVCWLISLFAMQYVPDLLGHAAWVSAVMLPATLIVGIPIAGLLVRPLGRAFELKEGKSNRDYIGSTCTISTGRVDDGFGQATFEDGGTVLDIPVRCDRSDVLARGDKALIIDFDNGRQAYVVEPVTDMLAAARSDGDSGTGA